MLELSDYVASVGIGAIIMLVVEVLKKTGVVPDGKAGILSSILNVAAFLGLLIAGEFGFDVMGPESQDIIAILETVGKLVLMVVSSPVLYRQMKAAEVFKKK